MTGKQLRKVRVRLGLTQKQLAAELGIHWNSLARWERDEVTITEPMARLIRMVAAHKPGGRNC
jgi:DNA-binding transcriptional regulator YiaG